MTGEPVAVRDLLRWSEALAAIAQTGLAFSASTFERERYEEVLAVAADIKAAGHGELSAAGHAAPPDEERFVVEWLAAVRPGVAGYATPKVAVGAFVGNAAGELLLVQRRDSGIWLYPTGWADVGYSAAEVAIKEVREETGVEARAVRLAGLFDGLRRGFSAAPLYSLVFHLEALDDDPALEPHVLECRAAGWFAKDALPEPLAGATRWVDQAFRAIRGEPIEVLYDAPRSPVWKGDERSLSSGGGPAGSARSPQRAPRH